MCLLHVIYIYGENFENIILIVNPRNGKLTLTRRWTYWIVADNVLRQKD